MGERELERKSKRGKGRRWREEEGRNEVIAREGGNDGEALREENRFTD